MIIPAHYPLFIVVLFNTARIIISENLSPHPMLYFSPSQVLEMRAKASTTHFKIATDIRDSGKSLVIRPDLYIPPKNYSVFASRWNEVYGNNLCGFSVYSFLYPEDHKTFDHLLTYMDRMSSYPDWYVTESYGKDQVPIGHSLTGFATAYDFLYDRLDVERRDTYYNTIKRHSQHLYMMSMKSRFGWTKQYIHNHAASNYVGLLLGALVVAVQEPQLASLWIKNAKQHLDFAMEILAHITDGSLDEGVSYGSYTSRGITQYVFLANRHLETDHTNNPWLKEHFWFYYNTLLPGFQRAIGVADANHNWFFGPGSQLVFLDAYVMKNGYGNWLAAKIRRARPKNKPLASSRAHSFSMLHTEYIFFNASLRLQKPSNSGKNKLHLFTDWGVVTYGGAQDMKRGNTFLSFKSSVLNGEAVEDIRYNNRYSQDLINGWKHFNPGHEHPDQNSFVFAPNGRYFITEALYGPKLTYLDNVLIFAPSDTSACFEPWEGQLGECSKWLKYNEYEKGMRGEILTAVTSGTNMAFFAGESVGAYSKSLGLSSVFRGLLLLNPEVLVVFDSIKLLPGSKTKVASALFHNMLHHFKEKNHLGYKGAKVQYPEGSYSMITMKNTYDDLNISLHSGVQPVGLREGPTNYINVTFNLKTTVTNVVHVFSGPNNVIKSASILPKSGESGIYVSLNVNGVEHLINVSTFTKGRSKRIFPIKERKKVTGFAGYASVRIGEKMYYLGLDKPTVNSDSTENSQQRIADGDVQLVPNSVRFTSSSSTGNKYEIFSNYVHPKSTKWSRDTFWKYAPTITLMFPLIAVIITFLAIFVNPQVRIQISRKIRHGGKRTILGICVLLLIITINLVFIDIDGNNSFFDNSSKRNERKNISEEIFIPSSPFIFITSLPGSGGELLESLFRNPDDFLYLSTSFDKLTIPAKSYDTSKPNLCLWPNLQNKFNLLTLGWFTSLIGKPVLHFNQEKETRFILNIRRQMRQHFNPAIVLNDNSGFWNTKIPWIRGVIGKENFQPILVVRDPRSWIHSILHDTDALRRKKTVLSLISAYPNIERACDAGGLKYPYLYERFKQLESLRRSELRTVERLSIVWMISIANALNNEETVRSQWPLHMVRFEDLVNSPENTSIDMFSKLGLPLGLRYLNELTRLVKSQFFHVPFDGVLTPSTVDLWKRGLSVSEISRIEEICCPIMNIFNYEC